MLYHKFIALFESPLDDPMPMWDVNRAPLAHMDPLFAILDPDLIATLNAGTISHLHERHGTFINEFIAPAARVVISYEQIIHDIQTGDPEVSLASLRSLMNYIHSKHVEDPVNSARALLAITRKISLTEDPNEKIYLSILFRDILTGPPQKATYALDQLHLAHSPISGFDDKVYDNYSTGRKTTAQLILDAYIKGISELTIFHTNTLYPDGIKHGLEIAGILGIKVHFGFDFSVGPPGDRVHLNIYPPEHIRTYEDYLKLRDRLGDTFGVLAQHQENKNRKVHLMMEQFNRETLPQLNAALQRDYGEDHITPRELVIPPISEDEINALATKHLSPIHLGVILERHYREILTHLEITLKGELSNTSPDSSRYAKIEQQKENLTNEINKLSVDNMVRQYFSSPELDHAALFPDLNTELAKIKSLGCNIVLAQGLEIGIPKVIDTLIALTNNKDATSTYLISGVEIYNTRLSYHRKTEDVEDLLYLLDWINTTDKTQKKSAIPQITLMLQRHYGDQTASTDIDMIVKKLTKFRPPLYTVYGSDANGHNPAFIPGMGFTTHTYDEPLPTNLLGIVTSESVDDQNLLHIRQGSLYDQIRSHRQTVASELYPGLSNIQFQRTYSLGNSSYQSVNEIPFNLPLTTLVSHLHPNLTAALKTLTATGIAIAWPEYGIGVLASLVCFGITAVRMAFTQMEATQKFNIKMDWNSTADAILYTALYYPVANWLTSMDAPPEIRYGLNMINNAFFYTRLKNYLSNLEAEASPTSLQPAVIGGVQATIADTYLTPIVASVMGIPEIIASKLVFEVFGFGVDSFYMTMDFLPERKSNLSDSLNALLESTGDKKIRDLADLLYEYAEAPRGKKALTQLLTKSVPIDKTYELRDYIDTQHVEKGLEDYLTTLCGEDTDKQNRLMKIFRDALGQLPLLLDKIIDQHNEKLRHTLPAQEQFFFTAIGDILTNISGGKSSDRDRKIANLIILDELLHITNTLTGPQGNPSEEQKKDYAEIVEYTYQQLIEKLSLSERGELKRFIGHLRYLLNLESTELHKKIHPFLLKDDADFIQNFKPVAQRQALEKLTHLLTF